MCIGQVQYYYYFTHVRLLACVRAMVREAAAARHTVCKDFIHFQSLSHTLTTILYDRIE